MRLVVVVGVLIWTSLLVGVGSTSIGAERVKWDWKTWTQECLKECDDLPQGQKGPCFSDCVRRHIGIARQDFPEFQDQDFNDTLDMADSPELFRLAAQSSYPKYKGFTVGCYKKFCFRYKWKDSSRWGWIEDWDYHPKVGEKTRQYVPCKNHQWHQYCLDYVKQRPGDFPCYASKWSKFPCYKGRRFGCVCAKITRKSETEYYSYWGSSCWVETLMAPHYWDWARVGTTENLVTCSRTRCKGLGLVPPGPTNACSKAAHNEIDSLFELGF